jgi:hypothetical protein
MAVAINSSWKLPIADFFTSSVSGEVQANSLTLAISYLNDTGAVVTNITCDKLASNLNTIRLLGSKVQNHLNLDPSLSVKNVLDMPIHAIRDPCHILKLVRGVLHDYQLNYMSGGQLQQISSTSRLFTTCRQPKDFIKANTWNKPLFQ